MNLKGKFLVLAAGIMLTTTILAGMSYIGGATILFEHADRSEKEASRATAQAVAGKIGAWENVLLTASRNMAFMIEDLGILPGTTGGYLRTLTESSEELGFLSISLALSNGTLLEGRGWFPPEEYDPRSELWYRTAEERRGSVLTGLYRDPKTERMIVTLAVPVFSLYQEDRLLGVLTGDIAAVAFDALFSHSDDRAGVFLFDAAGHHLLGGEDEDGVFTAHPVPGAVAHHIGDERFSIEDTNGDVLRGASFSLPYGFSLSILSSEKALLLPLKGLAFRQFFFLCAAIVLLCALLFSAGRSVLQPMNGLMRSAEAVVEGDLTVSPPLGGKDEIALLAASFAAMMCSLKEILWEMRDESGLISANAERIDSTSERMISSFREILAGCGLLKDSLEESALKLAEMRAAASVSAEEGRAASLLANRCGKEARRLVAVGEKTLKTSERTVQSVDSIASSFSGVGDALKELEDRTDAITLIVAMIEAIARKTNLLSLNASIEAARAGAHGRGFAVVAEEIRLLSRQSGEAASRIGKLAGDVMQGSAMVAAEAMSGKEAASKSREEILELRSFVQSLIVVMDEMTGTIAKMEEKSEKNAALGDENLLASEEVAQMAYRGKEVASEMTRVLSKLEDFVLNLKDGAASLDRSAKIHAERLQRYRLDAGERKGSPALPALRSAA
jgi:methyl-accepting chemotaxis protein